MKWKFWIPFILLLALAVGCGAPPGVNEDGGANEGIKPEMERYSSPYKMRGFEEDQTERSIFPHANDHNLGVRRYDIGRTREPGTQIPRDQRPTYGYSEHTDRDPELSNLGFATHLYIDRDILAEGISQIVVSLPEVHQATVVVTDEDCIVLYDPYDEEDTSVQEKVELSAYGATPRWYHVSATDNPEAEQQIKQLIERHVDQKFSEAQFKEELEDIKTQLIGSPIVTQYHTREAHGDN